MISLAFLSTVSTVSSISLSSQSFINIILIEWRIANGKGKTFHSNIYYLLFDLLSPENYFAKLCNTCSLGNLTCPEICPVDYHFEELL